MAMLAVVYHTTGPHLPVVNTVFLFPIALAAARAAKAATTKTLDFIATLTTPISKP
jgi:hypothetical protein